MNNKEILKKAIEKCGYPFPKIKKVEGEIQEPIIIWKGINKFIAEWLFDESYYQIIFSHDFAKEFWGKKKHTFESMGHDVPLRILTIKEGWEDHLKKMVLKEEPLKYLETFLNDKDS